MKGNGTREARGGGRLTSEYSGESEKSTDSVGCPLNTRREGVRPGEGNNGVLGGVSA